MCRLSDAVNIWKYRTKNVRKGNTIIHANSLPISNANSLKASGAMSVAKSEEGTLKELKFCN